MIGALILLGVVLNSHVDSLVIRHLSLLKSS